MSVKSQAGFSLVEVVCAILVLGVGLVGLTQGVTTALSSSKESEVQTAAALLAAGQIETLRAEGYLTEGEKESTEDDGLPGYRWRQTVTRTSIDGLYDVKVAVENAKSGRQIYELQTLLFDPPVYDTQEDRKDRRDSDRSKRRGRKR
jgi:type IV pilus modification protein PilV